jgi:hypothetical protein
MQTRNAGSTKPEPQQALDALDLSFGRDRGRVGLSRLASARCFDGAGFRFSFGSKTFSRRVPQYRFGDVVRWFVVVVEDKSTIEGCWPDECRGDEAVDKIACRYARNRPTVSRRGGRRLPRRASADGQRPSPVPKRDAEPGRDC